jgi:hypothetical protein
MDPRDSAHVVEEKYLALLSGIEIQFPGCSDRVLVTVSTTDYHSRFDSKLKQPYIYICIYIYISNQVDVTLCRFIFEILYMFRAFHAHHQESLSI